jgi:hypothetical protein
VSWHEVECAFSVCVGEMFSGWLVEREWEKEMGLVWYICAVLCFYYKVFHAWVMYNKCGERGERLDINDPSHTFLSLGIFQIHLFLLHLSPLLSLVVF